MDAVDVIVSWRCGEDELTVNDVEAAMSLVAYLEAAGFSLVEGRMEQRGWFNETRGCHDIGYSASRIHDDECYATDVPVYAIVKEDTGQQLALTSGEDTH